MSKFTWLQQAHGLVEMVGDTGSVNGKDFRLAVEAIDTLLTTLDYATSSYTANGVLDEHSDAYLTAVKLIEDNAKANGR